MKAIHDHSGGNSIGLYGSGQLTVEAQWDGKQAGERCPRFEFDRSQRPHLYDLSGDGRISPPSVRILPPLSYDDIEESDMITMWGHNARSAHTIVFWRIADHKKKNGIVTTVADPRRTGTVQALESIDPRSSYHFPTINGDISVLNAIAHCIVTEHPDTVDREFLKNHTVGWEEYIKVVTEEYSPEQVQDRTMVEPATIREVARHWAAASRKGKARGKGGVVSFWGIGYNQHIHGQHNVISIINLHCLTGDIGRPGAGPFSMTGQPNAMGERLMGGLTGRLPYNIGLSDDKHRAWMNEVWGLPEGRLDVVTKAKNPGMMVGMFERALKGDVKGMFYMYTTHIHQPDLNNLIRPALKKMFVVVQDIYRHAPNNLYADVIFPALTWGEWPGGTYISSERRFNVVDGVGKGAPGLENCRPDLDMAIDKGKLMANLLGMDGDKIFPYNKKRFHPDGPELYDAEEVFEEIVRGSKGTDCDLTGMLEVRDRDGIGLYDQIRRLRGVQWPAPTYEIAKAGGTPASLYGSGRLGR